MQRQKLAWIWITGLFVLTIGLVSACTGQGPGPAFLLSDLAETGIAGTQQARTLAVLVETALPPPEPTLTPLASPTTGLPGIPRPTAPASACTSSGPGREVYVYPAEGFCFVYPGDFQARQPDMGIVDFVGPALGDSLDPVRAYISIQRRDPVGNRTLDEIMLDEWNQSSRPYRSYNIQLGGRDAVVAEGLVLGNTDDQVMQVLFTHHDTVFTITLSPYESEEPYSPARLYLQRFWDLVIPSFTFYQ
jgi:hypothetical protein